MFDLEYRNLWCSCFQGSSSME